MSGDMSRLRVGAESGALTGYQIVIRANTDIRNPPRGFVAALAEQFGRAAKLAEGRLCVTVPYAAVGDDTREAVETVLHAAAAHLEANAGGQVRVQVTGTYYTAQRTCHVLALCEISPSGVLPSATLPAGVSPSAMPPSAMPPSAMQPVGISPSAIPSVEISLSATPVAGISPSAIPSAAISPASPMLQAAGADLEAA